MKPPNPIVIQISSVAIAMLLDPGFQAAVGVWLGTKWKGFASKIDQSKKPHLLMHVCMGTYAVAGTVLSAYFQNDLQSIDLTQIAHAITLWASATLAAHSKQFLGDKDADR